VRQAEQLLVRELHNLQGTMLDTPDIPLDSAQEVIVPVEPLKELLVKMYIKKGMFRVEAEMAAARQVEADLRGIHSHGSRATPRYLNAMDLGDIDPRGQVQTIKKTAAMAVMDGGRAMGHVASTKAMLLAIELARGAGTGTVAVRNSQHFGAASVYSLLAAQAGMIGYCTTSTGHASVAAYGSRQPAVANNAFAWAAPTRTGAPFCLDMACATAAWGKVQTLGMYGQPLPAGWALDAAGNATTDPQAAKTLLPAAGARGYGLAFLCSVLAGPLVGGKMPLHKTRSPESEGTEHFFYAIDVAQFVEPDRFHDEIERTINDLHALACADGFDRITLPGELEWERSQRWTADGIPLHRDHVRDLTEVATKMKCPLPWTT
jgi:LDH2 family malate/lactate/ureidoglycolate dehydrogenase